MTLRDVACNVVMIAVLGTGAAQAATINVATVNNRASETKLNDRAQASGDFLYSPEGPPQAHMTFIAEGPSLKALGWAQPQWPNSASLSGSARFNTNDRRLQIRADAACRPACGNLVQVIFQMDLTGSIVHGSTAGSASGSGSVSVFGEVRASPSGSAFEAVSDRHDFSSTGADLEVNESLFVVFWVRPGDAYSINAALNLSVGATTHFGLTGSVTADFSNTFTVDPTEVFRYGYLDETNTLRNLDAADVILDDFGWGLVNNQIPSLMAPVPPAAGLMAGGLALLAAAARRRRGEQRNRG